MAAASWTDTDVQADTVGTFENDAAGEAIGAGDSIYKDSGDNLLYKADASSGSSGAKPDTGDAIGVALSGGSTGQQIVWAKRRGDVIKYSASTFVAGQWYVADVTPGGLIPAGDLATGNYSILIGYASAADTLVLNPTRTGVQIP